MGYGIRRSNGQMALIKVSKQSLSLFKVPWTTLACVLLGLNNYIHDSVSVSDLTLVKH